MNPEQLDTEAQALGHQPGVGTVNGSPVCYHDEAGTFDGIVRPACDVLQKAYAAHVALVPETDADIAAAYKAVAVGAGGDAVRQLARDKMMGLAERAVAVDTREIAVVDVEAEVDPLAALRPVVEESEQ